MAVPSVGRGSPSPVRPAMPRYLGTSGPAGSACSTAHVEIYVHPVPCAGVRQRTVVTVHLSIDLSLHTYTHIYISLYTRRYWWMRMDTGCIARRRQLTLLPPALAPPARTSLRPVVGAPLGVDAGPGGPPRRQLANTPACPLHGDRLRERSARNGLPRTGECPPGHRCPPLPLPLLVRPPPRSTPILPSPSANWPTLAPPRSPPSPRRRPPGAALPWPTAPGAHAHAHACPPWPSLRRPWSPRGVRGCGGRVQRSPSSSVAVELRPPPRGPVTLPHAGSAHRLSHRLSGPRRAPLVRANAPVSGDDSRGRGVCTQCGPPGLEHPSPVANWQTHCACAAAGPGPSFGMAAP